MEGGSTVGLWIASGVVVLFLLLLGALMLRTMLMVGLLLLMPASRARDRLRAWVVRKPD